jgi:hypothetical protein
LLSFSGSRKARPIPKSLVRFLIPFATKQPERCFNSRGGPYVKVQTICEYIYIS